MRLSFSKSKNSTSMYVIKSTYENGVRSSKIVEKLGTLEELRAKLDGQDPIAWAKRHVEELNMQEKENRREVSVRYSPSKLIDKGLRRSFNGGHLFFEKIYCELGINDICKDMSQKYRLAFDLSAILSRLVYANIFSPFSSYGTDGIPKGFIKQSDVEDKNIRRALEVIAKEADLIRRRIYKNKGAIHGSGVSVADCNEASADCETVNELHGNPFAEIILSMGEEGDRAHDIVRLITQAVCSSFEKKLNGKYDHSEIIRNIREMNFFEIRGEGYVPTYVRTDFTDDLHEAFGFRTDYQIVSARELEKILKKISS